MYNLIRDKERSKGQGLSFLEGITSLPLFSQKEDAESLLEAQSTRTSLSAYGGFTWRGLHGPQALPGSQFPEVVGRECRRGPP